MCLYVKKLPTNNQKLLLECEKVLVKNYYGNFITQVMYKEIPETGWLFPTKIYKKSINVRSNIYGGHIHAYRAKYGKKFGYINKNRKLFNSYAFNVVGIGNNDIACSALYIPELDKTIYRGRNENDIKKLKNLKKKGKLTQSAVLEFFPFLAKYYK